MSKDSLRSILLPFVTGLFCGSAVWLVILFCMRPDPQIDLLKRASRRIEALEVQNQYLKDRMKWMASTQPKIISIRLPASQPATATAPATQPSTRSGAPGEGRRRRVRQAIRNLEAIGSELDRLTRDSKPFPPLTTLVFVDPASQPATAPATQPTTGRPAGGTQRSQP